MFIFPIGHEEQTTRSIPYLTFALIVFCMAVYAIAQNRLDREEKEFDRLQQQMKAIQVAAYLEYHERSGGDMITAIIDKRASNYNEIYSRLSENIELYWKAFAAGKAVEQDDPLYLQFQEIAQKQYEFQESSLIWRYGLVPAKLRPLSLLTCIFMHASLGHLLANMLFLFFVGFALEDVWGKTVFVAFFLAAGIAASLAHIAMNPSSAEPAIGASGAIAGLMGAFLLRFYRVKIYFFYLIVLLRVHMGRFSLPSYVVLPFWLLQQVYYASLGAGGEQQVAFWAHIGGFAFGVLGAFALSVVGMGRPSVAEEEKAATLLPPRESAEPSVEKRRERIMGLLADGRQEEAAFETDALLASLLVQENLSLANEILADFQSSHADYRPSASLLLQLAGEQKRQWNNERALALYAQAAEAGGPTMGKALLAMARIYAQRLRDREQAEQAYRRFLKEASSDDPAVEIARRELAELEAE